MDGFTDYNPDHRPSSSSHYIEDFGSYVIYTYQVRGIGVFVLRLVIEDDVFKLVGMSIYTNEEIGKSL